MSRGALSVPVLISTLAIFAVVVVATAKRVDAPDEQPCSRGSSQEAEERGLEETGRVVSVNPKAVSGKETAVSGTGRITDGNEVATDSNVTAIGGNATASRYAVGGNAIVLSTAGEFALFYHNTSGDDLKTLLTSLLNQFATDEGAGLTAGKVTAIGEKAVGGSAIVVAGKGARAVGGSAVFIGGKGGWAVGGSATVLGIVGGKLRVLLYANGETSNVSGRVAFGGVVTVP